MEKFDPTNEPFDPHMHNAVFQVADNSKPPGTVAHVLKVLFSNPFVYCLLKFKLKFGWRNMIGNQAHDFPCFWLTTKCCLNSFSGHSLLNY